MSTLRGNLFDATVSRAVIKKSHTRLISFAQNQFKDCMTFKSKTRFLVEGSFSKLQKWKYICYWVCQALLGKERFNANLCLCLWILILQRNVFSGGGIVLLVQAHTTLGMVEIIIKAASRTIRTPVATVEATLGLAGTEILDLYPTVNKVMFQVQVSSLTP